MSATFRGNEATYGSDKDRAGMRIRPRPARARLVAGLWGLGKRPQ